MKTFALLTLASALALSLPAQATTWSLTFSSSQALWGGDTQAPPLVTLQLVTEDHLTTSTARESLGEGYKILSFTGVRNGQAIQSVMDAGNDAFFSFGLDNYLYPATPDLLSYQGLGYTTADGTKYNLYGATSGLSGVPETQWWEMTSMPSTNPYSPNVTFQGALTLAAVPEPGTWAFMLAGGAFAMAMARRRRAA